MRFYQQEEKTKPIFKTQKRKWPFFLAGLIFIAFLAGIIYFINSSFFEIKSIQVNGLPEYEVDLVINHLKDFYIKESKISAFLGASNILAWRGSTEEFLKENPFLETLEIKKNYYKKNISIQASERKKYGIWCNQANIDVSQNNGESTSSTEVGINDYVGESPDCWWFDENGIIFKETAVIESELFNRINDYSQRNLKAGDEILIKQLFGNLKSIFSTLEKIGLNAKTINIKDLSMEEVYVESVSDPTILFSLKYDPIYVISAVEALKKDGRWQKISYVDFRVENKAYYKFK